MRTETIIFVLALALAGSLAAAPAEHGARQARFPQPAVLEPAVAFWTRVYTEADYHSGFIHDNRRLDVVYETLRLRPDAGRSAQRRAIRKAIKRYQRILQSLAAGRRTDLNREQQRVLSLWGSNASAGELKAAAKRLRFQRGQADKFRQGLVRAGAWEGEIRKILSHAGLPTELAALPHVESSYDARAKSHAGAVGLWQLMRATGRRYLRADHVVDARLDPLQASEAATRLLQHNYSVLHSWPLAITAYNHGLAGMRRAVKKTGSKDIGVIVERYNGRLFGFASRNFYAAFLAALAVSEQPERYFGPISRKRPTRYSRVTIPAYLPADALSDALGVDGKTLRSLNPAIQPSVWRGKKFVPKGYELRLPARLSQEQAAKDLQLAALQRGFAEQQPDRFYKVRRGDTLSVIARRHKASVSDLMVMNSLRSRHRIRVGQTLRLPNAEAPQPLSLKAAAVAKAGHSQPQASTAYRVKKGDTVSTIARRFGVDEREFLAANDIRNRNLLLSGQVLKIPVDQVQQKAETAPVTSADLRLAKAENVVDVPEVRARDLEIEAPATPAPQGEASAAIHDAVPVDQASAKIGDAAPVDQASAEIGDAAPVDEASAAIHDAAPVDEASAEISDAAPVDEASAEIHDSAPADEASEVIGDSAPVVEASQAISHSAQVEEGAEVVGDSVPIEPQPALSADPADYKVAADASIEIQAVETLGHYADWLDIRARRLRRLNGLRYGQPLVIGRRIKLDFSKVSPEDFEQRRLAHHESLQTRYFDRHRIVATRTHRVTTGDSLWLLATRDYRIPLWLLRQYNPDVDSGAHLPPGVILSIPVVEKLGDGTPAALNSTAPT